MRGGWWLLLLLGPGAGPVCFGGVTGPGEGVSGLEPAGAGLGTMASSPMEDGKAVEDLARPVPVLELPIDLQCSAVRLDRLLPPTLHP